MDDLFFDDWNTGSNLDYGDTLTNIAPSPSILPSTGTNWLTNIIKGAGTVATEVAKYKRSTLPNGSSIYTQIDPRTGLPIANAYNLQGNGISAFISQNLPLLLIGGAAIYFMTRSK